MIFVKKKVTDMDLKDLKGKIERLKRESEKKMDEELFYKEPFNNTRYLYWRIRFYTFEDILKLLESEDVLT